MFGVEASLDPTPVEANPASAWPSRDEHDRKYKELASRFVENMKKFSDQTPEEVIAAGPKV